jgi:glycogen operon protein
MAESHRDVLRFFQRVIAFRKAHPALSRPYFYAGLTNERGLTDISWHGTQLDSPGFDDVSARALACTIAGFSGSPDLHVMMNMFWEPLDFEVPENPRRGWLVAIDTFEASPQDIADQGQQRPFTGSSCTVQGRIVITDGT